MAFLYYVIITVHVFTCLFLIGVVLLQQGKGQDLASAFGGGGSQTAFGPRGSATVLSRATTILAALFMVTSFSLSVIKSGRSTVLDQIPAAAATEAAAARGADRGPRGARRGSRAGRRDRRRAGRSPGVRVASAPQGAGGAAGTVDAVWSDSAAGSGSVTLNGSRSSSSWPESSSFTLITIS